MEANLCVCTGRVRVNRVKTLTPALPGGKETRMSSNLGPVTNHHRPSPHTKRKLDKTSREFRVQLEFELLSKMQRGSCQMKRPPNQGNQTRSSESKMVAPSIICQYKLHFYLVHFNEMLTDKELVVVRCLLLMEACANERGSANADQQFITVCSGF